MARISLCVDAVIGHLDPIERLLWIGLITAVADDQGRMLDSTALVRVKVFPFDLDNVSDVQVERGLAKLALAKKITRYVAADGTRLIQIVKWWRHQCPSWAAPSAYPAPGEWQDRIKCHVGGGKVVMFEWDGRGGYIAGYVGRYVPENAADYVPDLPMPIEEIKIKDKVKPEGDGEGELQGPLGVKAPVPVVPPAPPQPAAPPPPYPARTSAGWIGP